MKVDNKTYLFVIIISILIIEGCSSYIVPLKGKYAKTPVEITTAKHVDSIWLNITQIFTEKGLPIKKIDKEKGLIVSKETLFIAAYTFEDKEGKLLEPDAWIVLNEIWMNKKKWNPKKIFCQWNIQITETGKGVSTIRVAPIVICTYYPNIIIAMEDKGQSTGKLEDLLLHSLSNK